MVFCEGRRPLGQRGGGRHPGGKKRQMYGEEEW